MLLASIALALPWTMLIIKRILSRDTRWSSSLFITYPYTLPNTGILSSEAAGGRDFSELWIQGGKSNVRVGIVYFA